MLLKSLSSFGWSVFKYPPPFRLYSKVVFDTQLKTLHKENISKLKNNDHVHYLKKEIAFRLYEKFLDIKRNFNIVLEFGGGYGHLSQVMDSEKVKELVIVDSHSSSSNSLRNTHLCADDSSEIKVTKKSVDLEDIASHCQENQFDAVISNLSLHWINDLEGTLSQIEKILKPDGVLLASIYGGDTLYELRSSLQIAQTEREGGFSPRISPMIDIKDIGGLLVQAGFHMLTIDYDEIVVNYPTAFHLMDDLSRMGESNATINRQDYLSKETLIATAAVYDGIYRKESDIPATFQVFYMIGWKKSQNMPLPLERGSAKDRFASVLENKQMNK